MVGDSPGYDLLASNLVKSGRFAYDLQGPAETYRTPGYPAFIAATYAVGGHRPWFALLVQLLVDTMTCWLIGRATARLCGGAAGLAAAACYGIDPTPIVYSCQLMSETVFTFLFAAILELLSQLAARETSEASARLLIVLGFLAGLAALVRPLAYYLPAVGIVCFAFRDRSSLVASVRSAMLFGLPCLLLITGWMLRNQTHAGHFAFSSSGPYNLLACAVTNTLVYSTGRGFNEIQRELLSEADRNMKADGRDPSKMTEFEKSPYWTALAKARIMADPRPFAEAYLLGWLNTAFGASDFQLCRMLGLDVVRGAWIGAGTLLERVVQAIRKKGPLATAVFLGSMVFQPLCYLAAAVGMVVVWRRGYSVFIGMCAVMIAYQLALTGSLSYARIRLPILPFVLPFTGCGVGVLIQRQRARRALTPLPV